MGQSILFGVPIRPASRQSGDHAADLVRIECPPSGLHFGFLGQLGDEMKEQLSNVLNTGGKACHTWDI